jgi:hypothetical protein
MMARQGSIGFHGFVCATADRDRDKTGLSISPNDLWAIGQGKRRSFERGGCVGIVPKLVSRLSKACIDRWSGGAALDSLRQQMCGPVEETLLDIQQSQTYRRFRRVGTKIESRTKCVLGFVRLVLLVVETSEVEPDMQLTRIEFQGCPQVAHRFRTLAQRAKHAAEVSQDVGLIGRCRGGHLQDACRIGQAPVLPQ